MNIKPVFFGITLVCAVPALTVAEAKAPGWMGVKLGQVPPSLQAHLGLEDQGLLVLNVATGSPADVADLHRYDVIVEFDGKPVSGTFSEFAEAVQATPAGTKVDLKIYREAAPKTVGLTLRDRPEKRQSYKYEEEPEEVLRDHFDVAGKLLRRMPDGRWRLDDMWTPEQLPKGLEEFFESKAWDLGNIDSWRWPGGQHWKSRFRKFQDGSGLEIERHEDGTIIVRRFNRSGDVEKIEKNTYKNEKELKEADPKAHEHYTEMKAQQWGPVMRPFAGHGNRFRDKWMEALNLHMNDALANVSGQKHKPFTSFTVDEKGGIDVVIRRRDGEIKKSYKDEAELQMRDPELYKRFMDLQDDANAKEADGPDQASGKDTDTDSD